MCMYLSIMVRSHGAGSSDQLSFCNIYFDTFILLLGSDHFLAIFGGKCDLLYGDFELNLGPRPICG